MRHFIDIEQLNKSQFLDLLTESENYGKKPTTPILSNQIVANLFFEPSTRTRCSFEIAAKRLSADVINLDSHSSSSQKGETAIDTALNLHAMGVNTFVIRHRENDMVAKIANALGENCTVLNAGCGTSQHPSQAVLDMLTIQQLKKDFSTLTVAIIGDMRHSRVAPSNIVALQILGVKEIRLIAPQYLLPEAINKTNITIVDDINTGLSDVDVIMTLRLQKERMQEELILKEDSFSQQYGLTTERLLLAKPDAIVMHPGPMNRGIEISNEVADGLQSVILQQTANGVSTRMALLAKYHCQA
jgi:aspartate carbamoyltransferase catalytic subunit